MCGQVVYTCIFIFIFHVGHPPTPLYSVRHLPQAVHYTLQQYITHTGLRPSVCLYHCTYMYGYTNTFTYCAQGPAPFWRYTVCSMCVSYLTSCYTIMYTLGVQTQGMILVASWGWHKIVLQCRGYPNTVHRNVHVHVHVRAPVHVANQSPLY